MIACTSTASASRRKSTFPSTPRLRSSPRTSMLSLTTSSPPRASTVFAREDDAVVSLSLDLCYTTSWDSTLVRHLPALPRDENHAKGWRGAASLSGGSGVQAGAQGQTLLRQQDEAQGLRP